MSQGPPIAVSFWFLFNQAEKYPKENAHAHHSTCEHSVPKFISLLVQAAYRRSQIGKLYR